LGLQGFDLLGRFGAQMKAMQNGTIFRCNYDHCLASIDGVAVDLKQVTGSDVEIANYFP
jgi:hypothetical protein